MKRETKKLETRECINKYLASGDYTHIEEYNAQRVIEEALPLGIYVSGKKDKTKQVNSLLQVIEREHIRLDDVYIADSSNTYNNVLLKLMRDSRYTNEGTPMIIDGLDALSYDLIQAKVMFYQWSHISYFSKIHFVVNEKANSKLDKWIEKVCNNPNKYSSAGLEMQITKEEELLIQKILYYKAEFDYYWYVAEPNILQEHFKI